MQIAYHIGAHATEADRLLRSLLRNRDTLSQFGVAVPGPSKYRPVLRDVVTRLRGLRATPEGQDIVLETILEGEDPSRLILSNESFISVPARAVGGGKLYPRMEKAAWLRNVFPEHEVGFFLAIRDPATLLPALAPPPPQEGAAPDPEAFDPAAHDPRALRWSDAVMRLRAAVPDAAVTVWCNEDAPLIWEEVMRAMAGIGPEARLEGGFDLLRQAMTNEGMGRLRSYMKSHPPASVAHRRRVVAAFLDKFADAGEIEQELDLPGWDEVMVSEATSLYERDCEIIAQMPGVRFIAP